MEQHGGGGAVGIRPHVSRERQSWHRSRPRHRLLDTRRRDRAAAASPASSKARAREPVPGSRLSGTQRLPRTCLADCFVRMWASGRHPDASAYFLNHSRWSSNWCDRPRPHHPLGSQSNQARVSQMTMLRNNVAAIASRCPGGRCSSSHSSNGISEPVNITVSHSAHARRIHSPIAFQPVPRRIRHGHRHENLDLLGTQVLHPVQCALNQLALQAVIVQRGGPAIEPLDQAGVQQLVHTIAGGDSSSTLTNLNSAMTRSPSIAVGGATGLLAEVIRLRPVFPCGRPILSRTRRKGLPLANLPPQGRD